MLDCVRSDRVGLVECHASGREEIPGVELYLERWGNGHMRRVTSLNAVSLLSGESLIGDGPSLGGRAWDRFNGWRWGFDGLEWNASRGELACY